MIFERFVNDGCLSYLVGCNERMECVIIDPHIDASPYVRAAREHDMNIIYAIDTHSHADHLSGADALRDEAGARVVMNKRYEAQREAAAGEGKELGIEDILEFNAAIDVDHTVGESDLIEVGNVMMLAQETPGHTIDSMTISGGGKAFTGDALMVGQVGRPDLPGGNVASMYSSITKLKNLSEDILVYPAHDYAGNYNTSMGYEMNNNPFLKASSLDEFKKVVGERFPKLTKEIGKLQCGVPEQAQPVAAPAAKITAGDSLMSTMCTAMEGMFKMMPKDWNVTSAAALQSQLKSKKKPFLLDVRTEQEFAGGHVGGALNIHVRELPERMNELPGDRNTPIVAMCQSGNRSAYATMYLRGVGYSNVKNLDYGLSGWEVEGRPVAKKGGKKKPLKKTAPVAKKVIKGGNAQKNVKSRDKKK